MGELCSFSVLHLNTAIYARKAKPMNRKMKRTTAVLFGKRARKSGGRVKRVAGSSVIRWLICFMPVGLIMLWNPGCKWKKTNKLAASLISIAMATIIVCGILTVAEQQMFHSAKTERVSLHAAVEPYGPDAPAEAKYSYKDENIIRPAVVVTPEPTLVPETAYVNDGGKYFHCENCRFVKSTTPCYYVPTLLNRGFKPCEECAASELAIENTGEN